MPVIRVASPAALAAAAADWTVARLAVKPGSVLALPTGRTPVGLYAELVARSRAGCCNLKSAQIFNLDEFVGLAQTDPDSYAAFIHRHLIDPLQLVPAQIRLLNGGAADPMAECRHYDAAIEARGGIDLCILGLGGNGHIAFNEPGAAWDQRTQIVELSASTRAAQAPSSGNLGHVPQFGMTLGIRTLREARQVLLLIAGENKQAARTAWHRGVADAAWPVTSLLDHPDLTTIELC